MVVFGRAVFGRVVFGRAVSRSSIKRKRICIPALKRGRSHAPSTLNYFKRVCPKPSGDILNVKTDKRQTKGKQK